jgi:two-component system sensor histidine kinase KdpD
VSHDDPARGEARPPATPTRVSGVARQWMVWGAALAAATAAMTPFRARLDKAHIALAFLLLVLGGSASAGRTIGLALALGAFLAFNFFFLPPYNTFVIADPLDWIVLFAFLVTSVVAAQLLARARAQAEAARRRADEIDRLSALGAETLNVGRAEEALPAIAAVIQATLGVTSCELYTWVPDGGVPALAARAPTAAGGEPGAGVPDMVIPAAERGVAVVERVDGTARVVSRDGGDAVDSLPLGDVRALVLPLRVRDRTVGVLRLAGAPALALDAAQRRFLAALAYYAALGVERARLAAEAEHAEALREADRLKDTVIATVSHDLRTPLTTIKALAHDIGAEGDERAVTIEDEADRLNRLVADLLDLSRLDSGAFRVALELNAAEDLVGAALQRVSGAVGDRRVDAAVELGEPVLLGRFDFVQALRALVNLIENAHKYSPPNTPIDVRARRAGAWLLVEVADRGPGVPPAEAEQIFRPFYRPPGVPPDVGGSGLGLTIARRLAEAQGGTITYAPRDGGGSVFTLALPAGDLSETAAKSL